MPAQEPRQGCIVRRATAGDAYAIARVMHESFVEYEPSYTAGGFAATTPAQDLIETRLAEGPTWVALQDDAIVGTVAAVLKGEGVYVRSMAILPSARGNGIGNLLLREVETFAHDNGAKYMFLSTTPFLSRAIRLYEKYGFQRTDDGPHELFGTPLFTMVKPLPPRLRARNLLSSFSYAFAGLAYCFRTQRNFRIHLSIALIAALAGVVLGLTWVEWAVLFTTVTLVLCSEMVNTMIESLVDLVTAEYHPLAKVAKDVAAGIVLLTAIGAVAVGLAIFGPKLLAALRGGQ